MTCLASRIKKKVVGRRMKRQTHKVCSLKTLNVFFGESDLEFLRLVLVGVSANGRVKTWASSICPKAKSEEDEVNTKHEQMD